MYRFRKLISAFIIVTVLCGCEETVLNEPQKIQRTADIAETKCEDLGTVCSLINEEKYEEAFVTSDQAIREFNRKRPGTDALYYSQIRFAKDYAQAMRLYKQKSYYKARDLLVELQDQEVVEELREHYDAHVQTVLDDCNKQIDQMIKNQVKAIDDMLDQVTEYLKNDDLKQAQQTLIKLRDAKIDSEGWRDSSYAADKKIKLYDALWDYYIIIHSAETGDYMSAYYLYDTTDTASLPKALKKKYESAFTKIEEEYKKEYYKYLYGDHGKSDSSQTGSGKKEEKGSKDKEDTCYNEDYDVCEYIHPEDFWYDNMDFFDSFEDAEDYYNEHWGM